MLLQNYTGCDICDTVYSLNLLEEKFAQIKLVQGWEPLGQSHGQLVAQVRLVQGWQPQTSQQ